jgi:GAF domain-containing protein
MVIDQPNLLEALADATRRIGSSTDLRSNLDTLINTVRQALPGVDHAGISVSRADGTIEALAGSDPFAFALDRLQFALGDGPCLSAIQDGPVASIEDATTEQRWPLFMPAALALGIRSQMGLRIFLDGKTLGGLNLYATEPGTLGPDLEATAQLLAAHVALVLGRACHERDLMAALDTRTVIGQATGLVMERLKLTDDRAFEHLTQVSQHRNVKLRCVAAELVQQANDGGPPTALAPHGDATIACGAV